MENMEKADIVVVSSKGQIVIPQGLRQRLGIGAKSKLLVYSYEDALIMKKLEVGGIEKRLEAMYDRIDKRAAKYGVLTEEDIQNEVAKFREEKAKTRR